MDRAVILLVALIVNVLFGGPRSFYRLIGAHKNAQIPVELLRHIQRQLDRSHRSIREREARGTILVLALLLISVVLGLLIQGFQFPLLDAIIVASLLPIRSSFERGFQMYRALKKGNLQMARNSMIDTNSRFHALLDEHSLLRAGVEFLSMQFAQKILADAMWYLLLGLPGLFFSRFLTLMIASMPRHKADDGEDEIYEPVFEKTARLLQIAMHYIPVRFAAAIWLIAGYFLPVPYARQSMKKTLAQWSQLPDHTAIMLYSASHTLGISLGGVASAYYTSGWLGDGPARFTTGTLGRALLVYVISHLFIFITLGLFF